MFPGYPPHFGFYQYCFFSPAHMAGKFLYKTKCGKIKNDSIFLFVFSGPIMFCVGLSVGVLIGQTQNLKLAY